jgi:hypothetical protein
MDWKTTYQQLDNASLLGLLPLLKDRIEQGKQQLEGVSSSIDREQKFNQYWLDEAVELREQAHDADVATIIERFEQTVHAQGGPNPKEQQFQRGLLGYLVELETRRKWIVEVEAVRRGLLPDQADFLGEALRR